MIALNFFCRMSWCRETPVTQQHCHTLLQGVLHVHPFQATYCKDLTLETEKICNGLIKLEQPITCEGTGRTAGWWPESLSSSEAGSQYLLVTE